MHLPGLLVEYLITGTIVALMCFAVLVSAGALPADISVGKFVVFAPAVYVIGIVTDALTSAILHPAKSRIRAKIRMEQQSLGFELPELSLQYDIHPYLWHTSPDLARQLAMRSSKDRIARGAVISVLVGFSFLPWSGPLPGGLGPAPLVGILGIALAWVWYGCERESYRYKLIAARVSGASEEMRKSG